MAQQALPVPHECFAGWRGVTSYHAYFDAAGHTTPLTRHLPTAEFAQFKDGAPVYGGAEDGLPSGPAQERGRGDMDKLKIWGESMMDAGTMLQLQKTAQCPVVEGHVAAMPDAHVGIGSTVGSVVPTKGAIIPSCVGVDIGCGMIAVETNLRAIDLPDTLQPLIEMLSRSVPSGVGNAHKRVTAQAANWMSAHPHEPTVQGLRQWDDLRQRAAKQLGTLGSGNHFLEVCLDERDHVWMMLHSGSRGVGNILATQHIRVARALEQGQEDKDLNYFLEATPEFQSYIADMLWAQAYALENRELMMNAALEDIRALLGLDSPLVEAQRINCHHNFAQQEEHGGKTVWVTRKGAIQATEGKLGIIPGSMGTRSYIVRGLGNPDSYCSCSHGAGRRMSRTQAKRELTQESLTTMMAGKAWNQDAKALLDEHPAAYKDIDAVMEAQRDLVEVEHTLCQVLNYKGV